MQNKDQRSHKSKTTRTVYLDLQHELLAHTPQSIDGAEGDVIYCKVANGYARLVSEGFVEPELAYCSECIELFDPGAEGARFTVTGEEHPVKIIRLISK